jgi:hypothetical protein
MAMEQAAALRATTLPTMTKEWMTMAAAAQDEKTKSQAQQSNSLHGCLLKVAWFFCFRKKPACAAFLSFTKTRTFPVAFITIVVLGTIFLDDAALRPMMTLP